MTGSGVERPYPSPLALGVAARVELARGARTWLADVEAVLVERGLSIDLAPTVCDLVDATEQGKLGVRTLSIRDAVGLLGALLDAYR